MTPSAKRNRTIAIVLGIAGLLSVVMGLVVGILVSGVPPLIAGLTLGLVLIIASCGFAVAAASPPAVTTATVIGRAVIVALAWLAPAAVFVAVRLSFKICGGLNILVLPWDPVVTAVVHIGSVVVALAAVVALVVGYLRPQLRGAATVMTVFIALMIIPFFALTLLSLAGGTYPGCAFV
jgi:hypothetical protein